MCKYHYKYGSTNYYVNMHGPNAQYNVGEVYEKNKSNHKVVYKGHEEPQVSMKRQNNLHNKHKTQMKKMVERICELLRDLFLNEQDICNMARKVAKETCKKHENDTQSMHMWVAENRNNIFFYQETNVEVDDGGCQSRNMPFKIGIQTKWR